jgi:glycosyltransferase involved in cell wall biosynthesis
MRVLIVHNRYQLAGGEDTVVANERALLDLNGWETQLWGENNNTIVGPWGKITTAMHATYSRTARDALARVIAKFEPAVLHVHNFFPLLSPSVYDAGREAGVAVVQTLHNYRTICAGALLSRDGRSCEDCIGGSPYQSVLHGCYRGSRIGSFAVARMIDTHHRRGTWSHKVDRFIALTTFAKSKFVAAGFPEDRIAVKANFTPYPPVAAAAARGGALFVGRLSPEKGITTLLRAWDDLDVPLRIVGDGPMRGLVENANKPNVVAIGWKTASEVAAEMAQAAFLVVPSTVWEGFALVIVEAFALGLPVIVSRVPALTELVEEGVTGLLFPPGSAVDLAAQVRWAFEHPEAMRVMGANARRLYEEKYSPSVNFRELATIYEAAIEQNRSPINGHVLRRGTIAPVSMRQTGGEVDVALGRNGRAGIELDGPLVTDTISRGHVATDGRSSTLKVTVVGHFVYRGRVGGAEQMFYNLVHGMVRRGAELTLLCGSTTNLDPHFINELKQHETVRLVEWGGGMRRFVAEQGACLNRSLHSDAVLFPNYFVPPLVSRKLGRIVTVLHDLQYRYFPENFSSYKRVWLDHALRLALHKADTLVVISNSVRDDLLSWLGNDHANKICVIPNPVSWDRFGDDLAAAPPLPNPYVLTVAAQYAHKNLVTLVRAFASVARVDPDIQLVFCGQEFGSLLGVTGRGADLSALAAELGIAERVHFTGYLGDAELGRWYRGATMFAFPSLFEGFGMPPVEALGFGLPTLTSRISSLVETTLGSAHYVDAPLDATEWADRILEIMRNPAIFRPSSQQVAKLKAVYHPERVAELYLRACEQTGR